ncbi:hypothetical protein KW445_19110 [Vibrio fluvialis]|nr:hypothetical protein [Vibrio fluvialis]
MNAIATQSKLAIRGKHRERARSEIKRDMRIREEEEEEEEEDGRHSKTCPKCDEAEPRTQTTSAKNVMSNEDLNGSW